MYDDELQEGDLITITGEGRWRWLSDQQWRVGVRDADENIRLHPCLPDGTLDDYHDVAGEYRILVWSGGFESRTIGVGSA